MPAYRGEILDAHHHLWRYDMGRHGWIAAGSGEGGKVFPMGDLAALQRDALPGDYLAAAAGQGIVSTIHVEAGWSGGPEGEETAWLDTLDRNVVARWHVFHADLAAPDMEAQVAEAAAHPRAVGLRDIVAASSDSPHGFAPPGKMDDARWRRGLAAAFDCGLAFDLMLFPGQMKDAARVVDAFPEGRFVLNHCGSPVDRSPEGLAAWAEGLERLAERPNIWIKVSNPFAYDHYWSLDSLRPVVGRCIEVFGPGRALFGSDYPVAGLHASFADMMAAYRALTADLSADEQRAIFHDVAAEVYGGASAL